MVKQENIKKMRIGEFLISIGVLNEQQVEKILKIQEKNPEKLFGEIGRELGYIDDTDIDSFFTSIK